MDSFALSNGGFHRTLRRWMQGPASHLGCRLSGSSEVVDTSRPNSRSIPFSIFRLLLLKILLRQRSSLVFALPKDRHNPPALTVVHQLNAVDAALKRFRVVWRMARFISTEGVRNLAKLFDSARGFAFVKILLGEK